MINAVISSARMYPLLVLADTEPVQQDADIPPFQLSTLCLPHHAY